jgi:hypothetical protein
MNNLFDMLYIKNVYFSLIKYFRIKLLYSKKFMQLQCNLINKYKY